MPFDVFGYNAVFELDQSVVNSLLATFLYEQHLIVNSGVVTNGDFIAIKVPLQQGTLSLYLELGKPFLHVQTSDGSDLATLHVPFSEVGAFLTVDGSVVPTTLPKFQLLIFNVAIQQTNFGLAVDLSGIKPDDVGISAANIRPGRTGVGGVSVGLPLLLTDQILDALLMFQGNQIVTGKALRSKLADFLSAGALGPTSVPISAGGLSSEVASWDLFLFGNANDRDLADVPGDAGADLLLFQDPQHGRGIRTQAGQTIPPAADSPQYSWSFSLNRPVLEINISRALDGGPFWVQGDTANTPTNPRGYLVVPNSGSLSFGLPSGGQVTVEAPQGGSVKITIPDGGLTPHSRAHVTNVPLNQQNGFTADNKGGATLTVPASIGDSLVIGVDAASLPGDSSVVVWRPQFSMQEGQITIKFHYYKYIEHWCDAEGDATVSVELYADRSQPFFVGTRVIDANATAPWWAYVITWFAPGLIGLDMLAPVLTALVPVALHAAAAGLIGGKTSAIGGALGDQFKAPQIQNLALFLDQVDVHANGMQLSGRADSGSIVAFGRHVTDSTLAGIVAGPTSFFWQPNIGPISVRTWNQVAAVSDRSAETFWSAGYDDIPTDDKFSTASFTIDAGQAMMAWIDLGTGHAKALFERPPNGTAPSTGMSVTWVEYRDRVYRTVALENHLAATVIGEAQSSFIDERTYKYDGTIPLAAVKFFLSDETLALGQQEWFWDDQPVTQVGIAVSGGSIQLDSANRKLSVHLDQSAYVGALTVADSHWVRFKGTDVFGTALETKLRVETPPRTITPIPVRARPPVFPEPGDPARDRAVLVAELTAALLTRMGPVQAAALATALTDAIAGKGGFAPSGAGFGGIL